MQKRTFLFLAVLCFLVVSVSVVFALSLDDFLGKDKITGLAGSTSSYKAGIKTGTCTDSDGGKEPDQNYVKGTVNRKYFVGFKGWKRQSSTDYCKNSSHLVEYTCAKDAKISSQIVNCQNGCENSSCSKTSEVSVSIATLKDIYNVGEKIELTDPPDNVLITSSRGIEISSQGFAGFDAINVPRILSMNYSSISNIRSVATAGLVSEESNGYIVQFSEVPLVVKENQLKAQRKPQAKVKSELDAHRTKIRNEHARLKSEIAGKIKTSRATGMAVAGEKTKSSIIGRIIFKLTGKVVSGNGELGLLGEYENVFNGIALNVSAKEADEIRKISGVKAVFPNLKVNITLMDSVPLINADDAWQMQDANNQAITGKGMKIAVIDTGVDYTHPDLGGCFGQGCKVEGGWDFVNSVDMNFDGDFDDCYIEDIEKTEGLFCEYYFWIDKNNDGDFDDCYIESASGSICEFDADPMDDHGHGTHCAGIAAGNGVLKGIAPDAKIYAYKVLSSGGWGYNTWVIAGIERAVDPNGDGDFSDKVDVISMSLGGDGNPDDATSQAVDNAVYAGVTAVIAAGNSGPGERTIGSPGTARKAITVGASDKTDNIAWFSSRGPVVWENGSIIKPDVVAPGVNICAAQASNKPWNDRKCFDDNHVAISGTSMATPHVAGAAALIKQAHPDWSPEEIKMALRSTAINIGENLKNAGENLNTKGYGRINVSASVSLLHKPCVAEISTSGEVYGVIDVYGTASCNEFSDYTLYYHALEDISWEQFKGDFSNSVNNEKIYSGFDTTIMQNGKYLFKLAVKNIYGEIYEDNAILKINNFEITGIGNTLNYIKGNEEIRGEIRLSSFDAYKIEYQKEGASAWTQVCYSATKPTSEVLCKLNIPNMENGIYYFNMSVLKNGRWISGELFKAIVIKEMLKGWPVELFTFPKGPPAIEEIDKDSFKEIVLPYYLFSQDGWAIDSSLYIFEKDGSLKKIEKTYKDNKEYFVPEEYIPSIYYDSQTSENFIALTNYLGHYGGGGGIIDNNGNFKFDWPYYPDYSNSKPRIVLSPFTIIGDRLFAISFDVFSTELMGIIGLDKNGNLLENFPITIKKENLNETFIFAGLGVSGNDDESRVGVLAGNFEIANTKEGYSDVWHMKLYLDIYSYQGNLIKRVYLFDDMNQKVALNNGNFAIADLNNDGKEEFVVTYGILDYNLFAENRYNIEAYKSYTVVIDSEGNIISRPFEIKGYFLRSLAIGDFGRGKPDIVVALSDTWATYTQGQKLAAFDYSGNILFNINLADYNDISSGIAIGDVNADNEQEIVINYRPRWWSRQPSGFQIFNKNGVLEKKIEIPTFGEVDYYDWDRSFILDDFNKDGKMDIIQQALYIPLNGINKGLDKTRIYIISLDEYEKEADWPVYMHDNQRTRCFDCIRPESKIVNKGGADVTGNLTITISRKTDNGWDDNYKIVFFRKSITVPANGLVKLDALFNPLDIRIDEPGNYSVYMEFKDKSSRFEFRVEGSSLELVKIDIG
jgi:subtilisin family serine protease